MSEKNKGGRPRIELTEEQIDLIEKLASFGLTQAQIAHCLPMAERTLRDRLNDTEDEVVSAAYARGRALDAQELSKRHRDMAMGKMRDASPSDQRKALEWRLERQHKFPALHEVDGSLAANITITRRVVDPESEEDG